MLKYPYIRNLHYTLCSFSTRYHRVTDTAINWVDRKVTSKIPEGIRHTIDKTIYMFETQLPLFALLAAGVAVSMAAGATLASCAPWLIPGAMYTIYDMINASDIYPYDYLESLSGKTKSKTEQDILIDKEFLSEVCKNFQKKECNNVILTGPAGAGKSTTAEALAIYLKTDLCPPALKGMEVFELRMDKLFAMGTGGQSSSLEMRLLAVLDALKMKPGNRVLFIDEVQMILDKNQKTSLANYLKGPLTGRLTVLGATTEKEYRDVLEKDDGIKRRFEPMKMCTESKEQTLKIGKKKYPDMAEDVTAYALSKADLLYGTRARPFSLINLVEHANARKGKKPTVDHADIDRSFEAIKRNQIAPPDPVESLASKADSMVKHLKAIHVALSRKTTYRKIPRFSFKTVRAFRHFAVA